MPKSAIALCLALSLTSCASIVSKSDWPVIIDSNPTGAALKITDESGKVVQTGTAPIALTLSAKQAFFCKADYDVEAQFPGQAPTSARMSAALNPWYFGNIIFGGLLGMLIIDPATGAMWKLNDSFTVKMESVVP